MWILLASISLVFSSILFFFSEYFNPVLWKSLVSIFPSSFFSSILFFVLGIFFLFWFSKYSIGLLEKKEKKMQEFVQKDYKKILKHSFLSYSHYLSYISFYIWVFLLSKFVPGLHFSYCLFVANIFVLCFFYFFWNLRFSADFLRINQIIFSLVYVVSYIYIFVTWNNFFILIDFINSFLVLASFGISFYFDKQLKNDKHFVLHFLFYSYVFIVFYLSFLVSDKLLFVSIINIILWSIIINVVSHVPISNTHKILSRFFGLVLLYLWSLLWAYVLVFYGLSFYLYFFLTLSIIMNFLFHTQFQNYICFLLAIFLFSLLLFVPSFGNITGSYNYVFVLFFSYFLILAPQFFGVKYKSDKYFIHFVSYIYNCIWILLFLIFYWPTIVQVALLMFVEFIYFFASYYWLRFHKKISHS